MAPGVSQWPGVVESHNGNGPLLWPCGHSRLYVVVAAGVSWSWEGMVPYLVLVCLGRLASVVYYSIM